MMKKIEICAFCGNNEFLEGIQKGYAALQGEGFWTTTPLKHVICRNCGTVVRSYIDNPEKLLKLKNRKEN